MVAVRKPKPDGRNISVDELNERRAAAVRFRLAGASIEEAAREAGLSRPTVIRAYKAYEAHGWEGVRVAERGRARRRSVGGGRTPDTSTVAGARVPVRRPERMPGPLTHLQRLEADSIQIMREAVAEAENPVMLYSVGKDSTVMLRLALKAFFPGKPPFPLLHIDTGWKFADMYAFRDATVERLGLELIVHVNEEGVEAGINPFTHGSGIYTDVMKTRALKQALDRHRFDIVFGGARRDEEVSRAKERVFSFRSATHRWEPKNQRPELWNLYNARKRPGESIRVFPLSNWTELDVWQYIYIEDVPVVPLYFAKQRPVVDRDGMLILVDDDRLPLEPDEIAARRKVRFRTLGCYPLTGAVPSDAETLPEILHEMFLARNSERQGRLIDHDLTGSMERKKHEGYF
jgi:sulfate adenylyltransferase subunit 2